MNSIYIGRSVLKNHKIGYNGDIHEIIVPLNLIEDIKNKIKTDPFGGKSTPFFYRHLPYSSFLKSSFPIAFMHHIKLSWTIVDLDIYESPLIMIFPRPEYWTVKECLKLDNIWKFGNPKAIQLNKKHKVWGNALFFSLFNSLLKSDFIKNYITPSILSTITAPTLEGYDDKILSKLERYNVGQKYIKMLVDSCIITYETGYILFGTQINARYVVDAKEFCQGGPNFHAIRVMANILLRLNIGINAGIPHQDGGLHLPNKKEFDQYPNFLWDQLSISPIVCENYELYNDEFKKIHGTNISPAISLESIKTDKLYGSLILKKAEIKKYKKYLTRSDRAYIYNVIIDPNAYEAIYKRVTRILNRVKCKKIRMWLRQHKKILTKHEINYARSGKCNLSKLENIKSSVISRTSTL